jgi:nitrate/nitrite transporter NarK
MPRIPTSLTLRSLIAMVVAFGILKFAPQFGNDAAQQIGEAVATVVALLAASGIGAGYMRRVFTPAAPEIEAQAMGFLGKEGWRGVRGAVRGAGHDVLLTLIEATMRRILDERERNAQWTPPAQRFADVLGDEHPGARSPV